MATVVSFGAITITGPSTTNVKRLAVHLTELSEGNVRYVQKSRSQARTHWRLQFDSLTTAERNNLETFFSTTADGPTNTFNYVHTDGVTYEDARFVDTELDWQRLNANQWAITITIEL